jgi:AraC family transcriptional regulator
VTIGQSPRSNGRTIEVVEAYRARFRRVLEYVEAQPERDASVDELSAVAAFSKFHFHRQFSRFLGMGVASYVQLVRFRRASYRLAFRPEQRIIDIALESGYESHEAFSRAFKKVIGQTPSAFRERPEWEPWHAIYRTLSEVRSRHMKTDYRAEDVKIVPFAATRVGVLEHRGDPALLGGSLRRFVEWRRESALPPRLSATFNLLYDDPNETSPEQFRMDLCAATERAIGENAFGIVEKTIPAGRCAVLRHVGSDDLLGDAIGFLYSTWLPLSGEEPRDFPLFLQRVRFFPEVPEHEAITDVFLPLR